MLPYPPLRYHPPPTLLSRINPFMVLPTLLSKIARPLAPLLRMRIIKTKKKTNTMAKTRRTLMKASSRR
jgi:hypothetical protein